MRSCWRTWTAFCATASVLLAPELVSASEDEEQTWPAFYRPVLLEDVSGRRLDGTLVELAKGFVFHRKDVEKIHVLDAQLKACDQTLAARQAETLPTPEFWSTSTGRWLTAVLGFAAGTGVTIGIAQAISRLR